MTGCRLNAVFGHVRILLPYFLAYFYGFVKAFSLQCSSYNTAAVAYQAEYSRAWLLITPIR